MECDDYLFEVILGTYEEFVLGYKFVKDDSEAHLIQSIATHSHRGSVRTVTTNGKLLASGSADETINIYDMFLRKESNMLMEHNGTVTCLSFTPDGSFLVSCSEDGSMKFFRVGSWMIEKEFKKAHKGAAVDYISIHPSGKLALTVGRDSTLRTWNLVKGCQAYVTSLSRGKGVESVVWSPDGNYYVISMNCALEIYSMAVANVVSRIECQSKISAVGFMNEKIFCLGDTNGKVSAYGIENGKELWKIDGQNRIRGIGFFENFMVTGTSSGRVCVYEFNKSAENKPKLLTSIETECRITCLTICGKYCEEIKTEEDTVGKKKKKKRKTEDKTDSSTNKFQKVNGVSEESSTDVKCTPRNQKWHVECIKKET